MNISIPIGEDCYAEVFILGQRSCRQDVLRHGELTHELAARPIGGSERPNIARCDPEDGWRKADHSIHHG